MRGVAGAAVDGIDQHFATLGFLPPTQPDQFQFLRRWLQFAEHRRREGQQLPCARVPHRLVAERAIRPGQQHVQHNPEQGLVAFRQRRLHLQDKPHAQRLVAVGLFRQHRHFEQSLVVRRQHIAADVAQFQKSRIGQDVTGDALRPKPRRFLGMHRNLVALGGLVAARVGLFVDVLEDTMLAHERQRRRSQAAAPIGLEPVFDHPPGEHPPEQEEQVVGVAAHQCAGEQHRLAAFGRQHAHGLALGRTVVLVLVGFVGNQQVEETLRQIPLDILRGLVAALPEGELRGCQTTLHALRLAVAEHQFAVFVHQIDEVERVVRQQAPQGVRAEAGHQLVRRFRAYGRQLAQRILHGGLPVPDDTGPLQGPQPGFAVRAGRAFVVGAGEEPVRRHPNAFRIRQHRPAIGAGGILGGLHERLGLQASPLGEYPPVAFTPVDHRHPVEPHAHPDPPDHIELGPVRLRIALAGTDGQQLPQRVRAVQHPDPGVGDRLQDFPPPLVNQMWRGDHQGPPIAFRPQHRCDGNGHHGLARSHLAVDDRRVFVGVHQQFRHGLHDLALGGKRLAFKPVHNPFAALVGRAVVNRRVLHRHRLHQPVAEIGDELRQEDSVAPVIKWVIGRIVRRDGASDLPGLDNLADDGTRFAAGEQKGFPAAVPLAAYRLQHFLGLCVNFTVVLLGEGQGIPLDRRLGEHVQHVPLHFHRLHCLLLCHH